MLIEFVQELNQILIEVETLRMKNGELKAEKETFNSQLAEVNRILNMALEDKATLEADVVSITY